MKIIFSDFRKLIRFSPIFFHLHFPSETLLYHGNSNKKVHCSSLCEAIFVLKVQKNEFIYADISRLKIEKNEQSLMLVVDLQRIT